MEGLSMYCVHIYTGSSTMTTTIFTPLGELRTEVELPRQFIKEIEDKVLQAFVLQVKNRKGQLT